MDELFSMSGWLTAGPTGPRLPQHFDKTAATPTSQTLDNKLHEHERETAPTYYEARNSTYILLEPSDPLNAAAA
jgi:hypothetical protein